VRNNTLVKSLLPLVIVLALATAYGIWHKLREGHFKVRKAKAAVLDAQMLGAPLGSRVTLVQFSSAFCTPCRTTRALLSQMTADMQDVAHLHIDAEANLDLVNRLNILSTPTTLILDKTGTEVGRAVGAPKRDEVLAAIASVK
jgi:thiol-disulfide isomerase/thioredoxin